MARDFASWLSRYPPATRTTLRSLRTAIRAAAPKVTETFSYGLPTFDLDGKHLVALGAGAKHVSLYPMSSVTLSSFTAQLKKYSTSKGTVRFEPGKPVPAALVKKIVKARMAELKARAAKRQSRR